MLSWFASVCKRVFGFVNVFKKKSCGASPIKGETEQIIDVEKFYRERFNEVCKRGYT